MAAALPAISGAAQLGGTVFNLWNAFSTRSPANVATVVAKELPQVGKVVGQFTKVGSDASVSHRMQHVLRSQEDVLNRHAALQEQVVEAATRANAIITALREELSIVRRSQLTIEDNINTLRSEVLGLTARLQRREAHLRRLVILLPLGLGLILFVFAYYIRRLLRRYLERCSSSNRFGSGRLSVVTQSVRSPSPVTHGSIAEHGCMTSGNGAISPQSPHSPHSAHAGSTVHAGYGHSAFDGMGRSQSQGFESHWPQTGEEGHGQHMYTLEGS